MKNISLKIFKGFRKNSVRLPFKMKAIQLDKSFDKALNLFKSLEKKLEAKNNLRSDSTTFTNEYLKLDQLSIVPQFPTTVYFSSPSLCVESR